MRVPLLATQEAKLLDFIYSQQASMTQQNGHANEGNPTEKSDQTATNMALNQKKHIANTSVGLDMCLALDDSTTPMIGNKNETGSPYQSAAHDVQTGNDQSNFLESDAPRFWSQQPT